MIVSFCATFYFRFRSLVSFIRKGNDELLQYELLFVHGWQIMIIKSVFSSFLSNVPF